VTTQANLSDIVKYIRSEHDRWAKELCAEDPYVGDTTIGLRDVLNAHFLLAEFFAETGVGLGGLGPKDTNLLHSALSRQLTAFGNKPRWNSRIEVCATAYVWPHKESSVPRRQQANCFPRVHLAPTENWENTSSRPPDLRGLYRRHRRQWAGQI